ncbi:histidine kinase/DNA gyrase B/HSP90-like ATPase [Streptomyces sp. 1114.5]|uniref:ATP-binding protein n=1 Tax=Streptomyces sp. 1114.5 TaxID=1938830 RepID=UPI000F0F2552|nr:ATP-binding protein [Streptomyces sp. 1114.5]RKT16561.1 histidine kinase/DNA gyrase B/HSP90-like ATPase [Streptomyces sp. 1114.5]
MTDRPVETDPGDLAAVAAYDERFAAFVAELNRLHIEYGAPSYGEICGAAQVFKLPKAGITDLLTGKRLPSMSFLLEFVRVVSNPLPVDGRTPRGHKAHPELIEHWRRRWVELKALNRQVQSPLGRLRNAGKQLVEEAERAAAEKAGAAEEQARQIRSRAEAEAAAVLEEARRQAAHLVEEAEARAESVRAEAERARAEAIRVAVARSAEADRLLRTAREEAEAVRRAAQTEAQEIVDEGRRVSRLRTPAALRELREAAERITGTHLPELLRTITTDRLPEQGGSLTLPSVGLHGRDDVGRLARCFDTLHHGLATLAAEQALRFDTTNTVFTTLSRRTAGLVQRQLSLLDELERSEPEQEQLDGLFELDHLATRMRRNCENMLILAGEESGRRWKRPVPLVDVFRAAAGEVDQYQRIDIAAVPEIEVVGAAVTDLVHLLAELLENAASYSHPGTTVQVTARALPDGQVMVGVLDEGIGIAFDEVVALNDRLAHPAPVDLSVSRRTGLFVVGRLAGRHGVRVWLTPAETGGVIASVVLPAELVEAEGPA